jgi:hypothetical protein
MDNAFNHPRITYAHGQEWDAYANTVRGLPEAVMKAFVEVDATFGNVYAREVLRNGFGGLGPSYTYDQVHFTVKYFDAHGKHLLTRCFRTNANTGTLL